MSEDRFNTDIKEAIRNRDPEALAYVDQYVEEHGDCEESKNIREIAYTPELDRRSFEAAVIFAANTATVEMVADIDDEVDPDLDIQVNQSGESNINPPRLDMEATGDAAVFEALTKQAWVDRCEFQCEHKIAIAKEVINRIIQAVAGKMHVPAAQLYPEEYDAYVVTPGTVSADDHEIISETFEGELNSKLKSSEFDRAMSALAGLSLSKEFSIGMQQSPPSPELMMELEEESRRRRNTDFTAQRIKSVAAEKNGMSEHQMLKKMAKEQDATREVLPANVLVEVHEKELSELSGGYSPFTIVVDSTLDDQGRDIADAMREVVEEFPQFTVMRCELRATPEAADDADLILEVKTKALELYERWIKKSQNAKRKNGPVKTLADLMKE